MEAKFVHKVLEDLSRVKGVIGCSLVDKNSGCMVDVVCPFAGKFDEDSMTTIITTIYDSTEMMDSEVKVGSPELICVEFPQNYLIMTKVGEGYLLSVLTTKEVTLGRVRLEIKKASNKIADVISTEGPQPRKEPGW